MTKRKNLTGLPKTSQGRRSLEKNKKENQWMGFILLSLLLIPVACMNTSAQTAVPEGGFDNWSLSSSTLYEEPTGGWWTTLNSLVQLGAAATVTKTTDSYSGTYAAKLETKQWGSFMITGLLASGKFISTSPFVVQGKPFTDKPSRFKGYYKYSQVLDDSAGIYCMLTRYNTSTGKRDTIADAKTAVLTSVTSYTLFDLPFKYYIAGAEPDSIDIVFCSSSGDSNRVGSTLYIDDISLDYTNGIQECLMPELKVNVYPNPASDQLHVIFESDEVKNISCMIFSLDGKQCYSFVPGQKENSIDVRNFASGRYFLNTYINRILVSTNKINISR
jgi:hypothetical protein